MLRLELKLEMGAERQNEADHEDRKRRKRSQVLAGRVMTAQEAFLSLQGEFKAMKEPCRL